VEFEYGHWVVQLAETATDGGVRRWLNAAGARGERRSSPTGSGTTPSVTAEDELVTASTTGTELAPVDAEFPMTSTGVTDRIRVTVSGTVQGVGFRPHVHRLATELRLSGSVGNDTGSVHIEVEGDGPSLEAFQRRLVDELPPLARIDRLAILRIPATGAAGFAIGASREVAGPVTNVPPDTAPCADCLRELADPADRRFRYPFITCTNCGPRFTIVTSLPYDRPATTMAGFPLCEPCDREYHDPADRRFHAQPVACEVCGPRVWLEPSAPADAAPGGQAASDGVIAAAQRVIAGGAVVAVKGLGGFHLACRADDERVVSSLRERKHRPGKPFAVMVRDLEVAARLAVLDDVEASVLSSPAAPIVLLRRREDARIAPSVAPDNPFLGVMLPSSPLHHLLFAPVPGSRQPVPEVLVMTSGNLAEEPLCIDNDEARDRLDGIADAFLLHDRPIAVACDDSVVRVDGQQGAVAVTMLRRSRGFVPTPITLPFDVEPALAVGGQLKTTACLAAGRQAWVSPHIGDMGSLSTLRAFERTVRRFEAMHHVTTERLIVDLHPDYTTHRWALTHADDRPVVPVQHHHAHIAAVMAEHGVEPGSSVLGIAFDGTGYGTDGTIWGGEVLLTGYAGFERVAHLATVSLPGGDAAIRHPRRVALSHLYAAGIAWDDDLPAVAATPVDERRLLEVQLARGLRCVPTSSMGRLFDAVASLIGVRHDITFEAQAAIELEILATTTSGPPATLSLPLRDHGVGAPAQLDAAALIQDVVRALRAGVPRNAIALGFHHAVARGVLDVAEAMRSADGPEIVALSGGVFTNALLSALTSEVLTDHGFTVLRHRLVPPNDGGLALGQIAVAARRSDRPPDHPSDHPHHDGRS
jgi:hydrogenase maturation protein HypF